MKIYILFLLLISTLLFSQESVTVTIEPQPKTKFLMNYSASNNMVMKISGDKNFRRELEKSGEKDTQNMSTKSEIAIEIETFEKKKDTIPFVYFYKSAKTNSIFNGKISDKIDNFEGAKIFGHYFGNEINIDHFEGTKLDETAKNMITNVIKQTATSLIFPKKPLKIGDSFTQETPVTIPIQNFGNFKMMVKSIFTLKKIENGLADLI